MQKRGYVTLVDWMAAPEWLTVAEACRLGGYSEVEMNHIIKTGGVDLREGDEVMIEKQSLREFQEALLDIAAVNRMKK